MESNLLGCRMFCTLHVAYLPLDNISLPFESYGENGYLPYISYLGECNLFDQCNMVNVI
jgi:hypothetical protein